MAKPGSEQAFRRRLEKIIATAARDNACPLCVLRELLEAAKAIDSAFRPTDEQLAGHGIVVAVPDGGRDREMLH